ncbi:hypothetical protein HY450_03100 [Candidatus Pacearchaeota archaeon]|nr:hypothetical protein [Candidatus Pacearchaeota archaeon]
MLETTRQKAEEIFEGVVGLENLVPDSPVSYRQNGEIVEGLFDVEVFDKSRTLVRGTLRASKSPHKLRTLVRRKQKGLFDGVDIFPSKKNNHKKRALVAVRLGKRAIGIFLFTMDEERGRRVINFEEDNNALALLIYNKGEELPKEYQARDANLRRHRR